jgi:transcriptional regulator GlxA family with amidase domain
MTATILAARPESPPAAWPRYPAVVTDHYDAVKRVLDRLHAEPGEPYTVDDMAAIAMYSKFHFTRVFARVTGTSPGTYLQALRMRRAMDLLETTDLSVTTITNMVGYSSIGTFSSRFGEDVGLCPTVYRAISRAVAEATSSHPEGHTAS